MINVSHVYLEVASKAYEDAHSKSNTHRVFEFDKSNTRFSIEEMVNPREVRPARKICVILDE